MVLHRLNVWHLPLISGISPLRRPEIVACVRAACGRESFPATRRLRCWGPYRVGQSAGRPATHKGRPGAKPSSLCDELPGLKRAVAQGVKLGRPKIDSETERKVRKYLAKGCGHLGGGEVTRHRDRHGAAHLKGAGNEPARGAAMTSGPQLTNSLYDALDPPLGGTFHFENLVMPPLTKTRPKMVQSDKGGSLV